MNNLTGSMKDVAFATSPREFDLPYSTTFNHTGRNHAETQCAQSSIPDAIPDQRRRSRTAHLV